MIVITQNIDISFKLPEIRLLIGFVAKLLVFHMQFYQQNDEICW